MQAHFLSKFVRTAEYAAESEANKVLFRRYLCRLADDAEERDSLNHSVHFTPLISIQLDFVCITARSAPNEKVLLSISLALRST